MFFQVFIPKGSIVKALLSVHSFLTRLYLMDRESQTLRYFVGDVCIGISVAVITPNQKEVKQPIFYSFCTKSAVSRVLRVIKQIFNFLIIVFKSLILEGVFFCFTWTFSAKPFSPKLERRALATLKSCIKQVVSLQLRIHILY